MMSILFPIPPMHGPVTFTVGIFWMMIAFILTLFLLVILWVVWVVRSQRRAQTQAQMEETERNVEALPQAQGGEQPQVHAPEKEKILLWR